MMNVSKKLIASLSDYFKLNQKKIIRFLIIFLLFIAFAIFVNNYKDVEKTEMVSTTGRTFEKAVVTEIIADNLQENEVRAGNQTVNVKLLSGDLKGHIMAATSSDGNLYGAVCKVGTKVIVILSTAGDNSLASVYSIDREFPVYIFIAIFILVLCLIGGKNGIKSAVALAFTVGSIFYLFLPMIYRGVSPFLAAVIVAIITTIVTMYLIGGLTIKTVSAILGTIVGVLVAGIAAYVFGKCANISGNNVSNIDTLIFVGQNTKIQISGLLFAGVIIASLGAVMDIAISISSTINEIHERNPEIASKELFLSGMNVGKDMMGTMSNTLILAFTGGSLSILVINYAYNLEYMQMINSYSIGIEIMQGIAGSLGVILTVPFVSLISALFMVKKKELL